MSESYVHVFWIVLTLVLAVIIMGIIYFYSDDIEKLPAFIWLVFSPLMITSIFCLGDTEKFNAHLFWLVLVIIFSLALVFAFIYNDELEKKLGGQKQGVVWLFISVACYVSFLYFFRS